MSNLNYNQPSIGSRASFSLDVSRLNPILAMNATTGPASASEMSRVLDLVAQATRIPLEFFETVLALEASYPDRSLYSSKMPRDGDGSKPLPDSRYPHPSAYSARPPSKGRPAGPYYGLANVNKGTQIYIGVTQMSFDFYNEVKTWLLSEGVRREYLPAQWWLAPLAIQVVAPLVYYAMYGRYYSKDALVTPATVYMLHQQGPGWVQNGLQTLSGKQSIKTAAVVQSARRAAAGYF